MSTLSPGVQILIDQLANNPDEFFGPVEDAHTLRIRGASPKFGRWNSIIQTELLPLADTAQPPNRSWFLTDEEKAALVKAYTEACRVRFDTEVIATMAAHPMEEDYDTASGNYAANIVRSMQHTKEAVAAQIFGSGDMVKFNTKGRYSLSKGSQE